MCRYWPFSFSELQKQEVLLQVFDGLAMQNYETLAELQNLRQTPRKKKTSSMQESIGKTICFLRKSETSTHGAKNKTDVPHMKKLEVYGIRWRLYSVHLSADFGFDKTLTTWLVGSGNCSLVCFLEALIGFCSMRQYADAWQRNNEVLPIKGDWTLFLFECKLSWFCFSLSIHTGFNVFYYFLIFVCFVLFCSQLFMQCLFVLTF